MTEQIIDSPQCLQSARRDIEAAWRSLKAPGRDPNKIYTAKNRSVAAERKIKVAQNHGADESEVTSMWENLRDLQRGIEALERKMVERKHIGSQAIAQRLDSEYQRKRRRKRKTSRRRRR